jgi:HlyD family secretion protein
MKKEIALILIVFCLLWSCTRSSGPGRNPSSDNSKRRDTPPIIRVYRADITQILEENGEIAPETSAEVKSRISGRVSEILVDEGDFVNKNDIIAKIEPDLEQARIITSLVNNLKEKEITLANMKDEYDQKKQLYEKGFISRSEFKKIEDDLSLAEMEYNASYEEYTLFKSEIGSQSNITIEQLSILSPLAGIVLMIEVEEGELISGESSSRSGTLLFTIANLNRLVIRVSINEVDIYKVDVGSTADILIAANPQGTYTGAVTKISPYAVDEKGIRVFPTQIMLSEQDTKLRPGMSAVVRISISAKKNVLAIPVTALFIEDNREYVIIPTENGRINKVFVNRGINDSQNVEIIEGLKEGDRVYSDIPYSLLGKNGGTIPAYNMRKEF